MARGLMVWLLIMVAETVHGVLRGLLLVPLTGAAAAERIGWPVAALLVLAITTLAIGWTGLATPRQLLRLGVVWAVLTVLFELGIGALRGLDAQGLAAALNPLTGSVPWSAALMVLAPLIAARLRGVR
ncbi:hypothetical protein DK847_14025 [Aestuariivirga litoralis]|uniref:Uncharacterized protein n=1 Tax=Aestuariivirga litoralis TaxID=2650924 RepID=A0A2W2C7X0_9HYPH|nr:hypothetical protein [Aestuariivirga litoralis]PZF76303.1 hypothetical protein DK847_14025 [Aestuariivirga litoralis]